MIRASAKVVKNDWKKIASGLRGKVENAVGETIFDLEGTIKETIQAVGAVEFGTMLNSTQGNHRGDEGDVSNATEYWPYVNYGTYKMAARPFVEPPVDAVRPRHMARVKKAMNG